MIKKIAIGLLALLILVGIAGFAGIKFLENKTPEIPLVDGIVLPKDSLSIAQGQYLATHVALCMDCHSERDFSLFSGPVKPGTEGKGGELFGKDKGFPGDYYAANITPAHLSKYSDAELYRTLTSGVRKDSTPLFPVMPWPNYAKVDQKDILKIMAYIRTLTPIENEVPPSVPAFPMTFVLNMLPKPASHQPRPDTTDLVAYGKYLTTMASCSDCHTPAEKGKPIEGMHYAGGFRLKIPGGTNFSANITPHKETGIGNWTREMFVAKFKMHEPKTDSLGNPLPPAKANGFQSVMPWSQYAGMTEGDLSAIYAYLMTLPPVESKVSTYVKD